MAWVRMGAVMDKNYKFGVRHQMDLALNHGLVGCHYTRCHLDCQICEDTFSAGIAKAIIKK